MSIKLDNKTYKRIEKNGTIRWEMENGSLADMPTSRKLEEMFNELN